MDGAPPAPKNADVALDDLLQKPAAARLLAAIGPNTPIDMKVSRLIDRLVLRDRGQVQAAATALIMLGAPAVPSIILRMADRRDMPVGSVSFENRSPGAFESERCQPPTLVKGASHQLWRIQKVEVNAASLRLFLRSYTGPNRAFEPQSLGRVRDQVRIAAGPTRDFGFSILDFGLQTEATA